MTSLIVLAFVCIGVIAVISVAWNCGVAHGELASDKKWLDAIVARNEEGATKIMKRAGLVESSPQIAETAEMLSLSITVALNDVVSAATGEGLYL